MVVVVVVVVKVGGGGGGEVALVPESTLQEQKGGDQVAGEAAQVQWQWYCGERISPPTKLK